MGVLLYALLCGFLPFDDDNMMALYKKIVVRIPFSGSSAFCLDTDLWSFCGRDLFPEGQFWASLALADLTKSCLEAP